MSNPFSDFTEKSLSKSIKSMVSAPCHQDKAFFIRLGLSLVSLKNFSIVGKRFYLCGKYLLNAKIPG